MWSELDQPNGTWSESGPSLDRIPAPNPQGWQGQCPSSTAPSGPPRRRRAGCSPAGPVRTSLWGVRLHGNLPPTPDGDPSSECQLFQETEEKRLVLTQSSTRLLSFLFFFCFFNFRMNSWTIESPRSLNWIHTCQSSTLRSPASMQERHDSCLLTCCRWPFT